MKINEIFYSIQGEGKWSGIPNIFIRTTGCNLRCKYCDTKYAYDKGIEYKIKDILIEIKKYKCQKVCITGGEPLHQYEINKLIDFLIDQEYSVCVETNGSISIEKILKEQVMISLDIKCPTSGMNEKMYFENIKKLRKSDQIKFIISNKEDYQYAKTILDKYSPCSVVFFQPVWGTDNKRLAEWILNDHLNVRLGLQLHKLIWGEKPGK